MDDDDFLSYVYTHSTTPRALFSREHVMRLAKLADAEAEIPTFQGWVTLKDDVAHPLVLRAREILAAKEAPKV
jgi:hypothetical protein